MTASPFVSVLMAVHNGRRFVGEAIESILRQSHTTFEFIIIDDGSTDGVTYDLKKFAAKDKRIRLVSQQNMGLTMSLNVGLGMANGEIIARMDADDISHPQRFEQQVDFLQRNLDHACVGSSAVYIDGKSRPMFVRRMPSSDAAIRRAHLMGYGGMIVHSSAMMTRTSLEAVGGYNTEFRYAQDYDLWSRLAEKFKLANLPGLLIRYRWHQEAITQDKQAEQNSFADKVLQRELEQHKLVKPLALEHSYVVRPTDKRWLLRAALDSGFYGTAVRTATSAAWQQTARLARGRAPRPSGTDKPSNSV